MKKLICTAMVIMVMMTSVSAAAPARSLNSIAHEVVMAQVSTRETHIRDSWGLPMTHRSMKMFGIDKIAEATLYDFLPTESDSTGV